MKYSIDKLKIKFKYLKTKSVNMFLAKMEVDTLVTSCYSSNQVTKCKHNFIYGDGEGAVYVGVVPNWEKEEKTDKSIVLEYNPNKVNPFFIENLSWLKTVPRPLWHLMSFDIAVDISIAYNTVIMLKRDKREYMCSLGHSKIETRYLGKFGENGHIKLYDKARERKIDANWTRFEITIKDLNSIDANFEEFNNVVKLPVLYRIDTQLSISYASLNSVWRLALDTVANDATKLYSIDNFRTRKKMEQLLYECLENIDISVADMYSAYVQCFENISYSQESQDVDIFAIFYAQDVKRKALKQHLRKVKQST